MGLFKQLRNVGKALDAVQQAAAGTQSAPIVGGVRGTAQVVGVSGPVAQITLYHGDYWDPSTIDSDPRTAQTSGGLELVVSATGLPATPVHHQCSGPTYLWPTEGDTLPIMVNPGNPQELQILWDEVTPPDQPAATLSHQVAATSNGQISPGVGPASAPGETVDQLERLAELHRSGVLTDTEFEQQKKRILGES